MINEKDVETYSWHTVKNILFIKQDFSVVITFTSGNGLKAKFPDEETWNQVLTESILNLNYNQVLFPENE